MTNNITRPPAEQFPVCPFTFRNTNGIGIFLGKRLTLFIPNAQSLDQLLDDLEAHEHIFTTNTKGGNK